MTARRTFRRGAAFAVSALALSIATSPGASAQSLEPLLPDLVELGFVKNEKWAEALGKALFWDQAVGSDGMACASCHFHAGADTRIKNQLSPGLLDNPEEDLEFGAIALDTNFNTNPFPTDVALGDMPAGDRTADSNVTLKPEDFPFHKLADINDRNSTIKSTTNDRVASSGAYDRLFGDVGIYDGDESCGDGMADVFHAGHLPARQVEPRNTPTMINSAFFHRLFWDGRANNIFNGKDVFGRRDIKHNPAARVMVYDGRFSVELEPVEIEHAALASQAVGPPLSRLEMSCNGRTFADVGRAILSAGLRPLNKQKIHKHDSLLADGPLGDLRHKSGKGLSNRYKYEDLIKKAFPKKYWDAPGRYIIKDDGTLKRSTKGYTQMEHNFSLFWGLAIMAYEATLISDDSKFDRAGDGAPGCLIPGPGGGAGCDEVEGVLTELERDGLTLFVTAPAPNDPGGIGGRCTGCHGGPLMSAATQTAGAPAGTVVRVPQFNPTTGQVEPTFHDFGFFGVGSRPVWEDRGTGGLDPYGNPLSFARQFKRALIASNDGNITADDVLDGFNPAPVQQGGTFLDVFSLIPGPPPPPIPFGAAAENAIIKVDASFKTPILRNVALTPPYFHYGGYKSLEEVIDFYARGGSRRDTVVNGATGDDTGSGPLGEGNADGSLPYDESTDFGTNTDDNVTELNLALDPSNGKDQEYGKRALVAFLKTLTDDKVRCDVAPFDHPELHIFDGHEPYDADGDGLADDIVSVLPEVGAAGYADDGSAKDFCIPNEGDLFAPGMLKRVKNFQ